MFHGSVAAVVGALKTGHLHFAPVKCDFSSLRAAFFTVDFAQLLIRICERKTVKNGVFKV